MTPTQIASAICKDVSELEDRNSPADWPEAMLVTADELRTIVLAQLENAATPIAWGAFYFGGKHDGQLYNHCPSEEMVKAYIGNVHQSNDSITLSHGPLFTAPQVTPSTPNLENLQDRLLAPTPIERDDIGHWYHPHLPDCDEGVSYGDLLAVFGLEVACVDMESDAPEDVAERYFDQGGPGCSAWQPTTPEGKGWALLAIYDTEDGPYAMFARKAPEPRPPSLRTVTERARKFEAAFYKEARRAVEFGDIIQNHTHAMQAAVIEANLGKGTATAMAWIVNTLRGPGHLPDLDAAAKLDDPQSKGKAQVWFDLAEAQHALLREAHPAPQPTKGGV